MLYRIIRSLSVASQGGIMPSADLPVSVKVFPDRRTIFFSGAIRSISALLVEGGIEKIKRAMKSDSVPIYLIINSQGGDFYATLRIRAALENYPGGVITVIFGKAYSGGLIISQVCKKRLITKKSEVRFHKAHYSFKKDEELDAVMLSVLEHRLLAMDGVEVELFSRKVKPIKKLVELFEKEAYLKPSAAKKINLVDEIIPEPKSRAQLIDFLLRKHPA